MLTALASRLKTRARRRIAKNPTPVPDPKVTIDPQWVNLDEIRHWIYICTTSHGQMCEGTGVANVHTPLFNSGRPAWLVDVRDECIVPAAAHRYVALSYVWGDVRGTEAAREIMDRLQQPGALSKRSEEVIVPRTIRHAMEFIGLLEERYLWVDRFCICQDDAESKHSQLNLMGQIFGGAYFTIVAANGWDADHGLRGIRGVTEPRNLTSQLLHESEYKRCIDIASTVWYSRGWTFQEMLLSPRTLIFLYQYVIWECSRGVWHESTGTTGEYPAFPDAAGSRLLDREPDKGRTKLDSSILPPVEHYLQVVRRYNTRALTFPEDGLNAFLGITTQFVDKFPEGFLWALPIAWFDIALLWQPAEDMTRRYPKRAGGVQLPSWSWVGWQGLLEARCWEEEYAADMSLPHLSRPTRLARQPAKVTPICKFFYTEDGNKKIVQPLYVASPDEAREAPAGWLSPILSVYGPVARCMLRGGAASSVGLRKTINMCFKWICEADAGDDDDLEFQLRCGMMFMSPTLYSHTGDVECELLALSSAVSPLADEPIWARILDGYPRTEALKEQDSYEYYNVLWIARKDGVAYRRGLGKMAINVKGRISFTWDEVRLG
ncbi:hypothetical protein ANO14919_134230 [Xylariales sp. No.14919]|nr:hypothetical protein ANO14919_134230 [Xylariales sp. No.14919]